MRFLKYLLAAVLLPSIALAECAFVEFDANSNILRFKVNSTVDGEGLTGLTSTSPNLYIAISANNEATPTAYTVAGSTIESITTLGTYEAPTATKIRFKEYNSTYHKGIYEIHAADSRFSNPGAKSLIISAGGAANMKQVDCQVQLLDSATTLWSAFAAASVSTPVTTTGGGGSSTFRRW